jgi:ribonuclease HIII
VNLGHIQPDMSKTNITDYPVENNEKIKIDTSKNMNDMELCEVDFNLDEMKDSETVSIKQRNDVYYKMYHEARNKAKIARDLALSAYLEAKRIKNTYMLDDIVDSSDSEEEHDEDEDNESDNSDV